MAVTAQMVKDLREMTGAGMMDCKNALTETDGNIEKAIEILREKGLAKAAKKAGRIATEGLVAAAFAKDGSAATIVEVNSETDFVAKNQEFVDFVQKLAELALNIKSGDMEALMAADYYGEGAVKDVLNAKIAKIGENLSIRRFETLKAPGVVYSGYIHGNGKIGVLVGLETEASIEDVREVGKDVAMQVASMSPKFLDETGVDPEYLAKEKEIMTQLVLNEGKKADMVERIVEGKLKKEIKEVCLIEQKFVTLGTFWQTAYLIEKLAWGVESEEHVTAARARGLSERHVKYGIVTRCASPALITAAVQGLFLTLWGSFIVERVFSVPGVGALFVTALQQNDRFLAAGVLICVTLVFQVGLFALDVSYGALDPRIRVGAKAGSLA